jgi:2,3-bisphosphoglycerate-dependent phosphoglycerate mutase
MLFLLRVFMMLATVSHIRAFSKIGGPVRASMRAMATGKAEHQLVLLRHGESTWNDKNLFTGWYDCPLSEKGKLEAQAAGQLLHKNGFKFDMAFTSYLQRAIRTLWFSLEETNQMHIPVKAAWELNER